MPAIAKILNRDKSTVLDSSALSFWACYSAHQTISTMLWPGTSNDLCKDAKVQAIPKKDAISYRSIALVLVNSKVIEKIVNCDILWYLEEHNQIHDRQYGFRR